MEREKEHGNGFQAKGKRQKAGWDFSRSEDRNEARRELGTLKPMMIVGNSVAVVLHNFTEEEIELMQEETEEAIKRRSAERKQF